MQQHSQYCFPEQQMHILILLVMNYAIQAVAGVVIAVGAAAGIYWRKAKKKIDKSLGIDENRNKEVESDDIMLDQAEDKQEK